jgi:hypothetical protein
MGPRTVPWGTPEVTAIFSDVVFSKSTVCVLVADCIQLQEDLESVVKWEQDWLMAFHPDKCNILRVTTKKLPQHF